MPAARPKPITPILGHYFDSRHYDELTATVRGWRALGAIPEDRLPDPQVHASICRLLHLEARLIDSERLEEWLALYTDDCVYWLPNDVEGRDPRVAVTWEINDRRRLEERVERLGTGRAFSQAPPTRTTHLYTNIEVMTAGPDEAHVLCQFLIQANLVGRVSQRSGWHGFVVRKTGEGWRIVVKCINLYDADLPQNNNSFTL